LLAQLQEMMAMTRYILSAVLAATALIPAVRAQDEAADAADRGVARVSLMNGDVSVRRGDSGDWIAAALNAPLMAEDRVFAGPGSRGELQFDYYHRLRLAADTEVRLVDLDNRRYQMQLARGTVTFSAVKGGDAQVEISTVSAAVRPTAYGEYRITVRQDGAVEITVRSGEADIYTNNGSEKLRPGKTMLVRGEANGDAEFQLVRAVPRDEWDEFNARRDKDIERATAYQYVSRDVYGAEDLEGHGNWVYQAPYGYVWQPTVDAGWAPYQDGRWTWLDYYGWTWLGYEPWGWAPYHYGRWFMGAGGWCWYPGAVHGHYPWRPAQVAFFGFGGGGFGVGFGFGWGNCGWVPLAPFEPFYPWYGHGYYGGYRNHGYMHNNINVVNNTNIYNNYRNARVNGAVSVVNAADFSRGAPGRATRATQADLQRASLAKGMLPVTPGAESLRMSDRAVNPAVATRSAAAANERFYTRQTPSNTVHVPFEQQRQALEQVTRRSSAAEASGRGAAVSGSQPGAANSGGWRDVRGATPEQGSRSATPTLDSRGSQSQGSATGTGRSTGEWSRFGDPRTTATQAPAGESSRPTQTETRSGWQNFGTPGRATGGGNSQGTGSSMGSSTGTRSVDTGHATPATGSSRSAWSTGSGVAVHNAEPAPRSAEPSRPATVQPQPQPSRSAPVDQSGRGGSSTGRSPQNMSYSPAPMQRGGWSTGGGAGQAPPTIYGYTSRSEPSGYASRSEPSRSSGGWSTGSGASAPRSAPSVSSGGGYGGGARSSGGSVGYSAPQTVHSAPPAASSGGGGARVSSGGGGGASHSSSGGGGHHR
jgi:hypothetical protein